MKYIYNLFAFILFFGTSYSVEHIELDSVGARKHEKMPIMIGLLRNNGEMKRIASIIKQDLEFSQQFSVNVGKISEVSGTEHITSWFKKGYPFIIFLSAEKNALLWRLYDTSNALMISGKKIEKRGDVVRGWAHNVSDALWPELMGTKGFFSTQIVYGKGSVDCGKRNKKYLYVRDATDDEGTTERKLVASPTISVSPRWNRDTKHPLVLYSEYTKTNVRLISVDMNKQRKMVSNFDGVNMQAAYSPDGSEVVYCLSRAPKATLPQHFTSQLYHYSYDKKKQKGVFRRITKNQANNFAPCWGPNSTLFYSSDAFTRKAPDICWLDLASNKLTWVTQGQYAVCPDYSPATNKLTYCKMINKKMQVFIYDIVNSSHKQVTFDLTNKEDCSWSPCGNFIVYSSEDQGKSRLAVYNCLINKQRFLTSVHDNCSYPAWSPCYDVFPGTS